MAIKKYHAYVGIGIELGRREELTGDGLIRSLGGWEAVKKQWRRRASRIKGDMRILGNSDFVESVLTEAHDTFNHHYELRRRGYEIQKVASRVREIMCLEPSYVLSKGRQKKRVEARSLLRFWAARELGLTGVDLARRLEMTPSAVGYAITRGEKIAQEKGLHLIDYN